MGAAVSSWALAWWATGAQAKAVGWAAAAAGAGAVLALLAARPATEGRPAAERRRARAAAVTVLLAAGSMVLAATALQTVVRRGGPVVGLAEHRSAVTADLRILTDPHVVRSGIAGAEPRYVLRAQMEQVTARGIRTRVRSPVVVFAGDSWRTVQPGQHVRAAGRLGTVDPGDDVVAMLLVRGPARVTADPGFAYRAAERLRRGLRTACAGLSADAGGLLPGLVVGDTSRLPGDLAEAMRATGLTHLTAVSGSNVAIVVGAVLLLAGGAGLGRRTRAGAAGLALAGFVVLARPEPSVLRAAVMGAVGLVALVTGRRGRGVPVLGVTVVLLLTLDPWLARAYGFVLSVLATGGLLVLAPGLARSWGLVMPSWLARSLVVPVAAQAVCGPVLVLLAPAVSLLAVPANLVVAPAVAPATVLGVAAACLGPWWPGAAAGVAQLAGVCTSWIAVVARTAAGAPGAQVAWPSGPLGSALLATVTVLLLVAVPVAVRKVGVARQGGGPADRPGPGRRQRQLVVPGLVVALVAVLGVGIGWDRLLRVTGRWPPPGWWAVACDVGQGDAMVVRTRAGGALLVDAGPDPGLVDGCLRRLGIRHLDAVLLTHFHADHVAGLPGALRGRRVDALWVSPLAEPAAQARHVAQQARRFGLQAEPVVAGRSGVLGELSWVALWPRSDASAGRAAGTTRLPAGGASSVAGEEGSGPNDASVTLLLQRSGLRMLAPGDLEDDAQRRLRAQLLLHRQVPPDGGDLRVDVVKVAHHGSASQERALYQMFAPRLALVSSGAGNRYGHPSPRTVALLSGLGALVARTDRMGDVAVVPTERGLAVSGRRSRA